LPDEFLGAAGPDINISRQLSIDTPSFSLLLPLFIDNILISML
jgi:hypothetical protein